MGKLVRVKIVETGKHFLKGKVLSKEEITHPSVPPPLKKGQVSGVSETAEVGIVLFSIWINFSLKISSKIVKFYFVICTVKVEK